MTKEVMLICAAIISLFVAFFAIALINKLNVKRSVKQALCWITVLVPFLGLFLALQLQKKP